MFYGYNTQQEAVSYWGEGLLSWEQTKKVIDLVDDATKWPQTSSKQQAVVYATSGNVTVAWPE
jgi:hypothetical protein